MIPLYNSIMSLDRLQWLNHQCCFAQATSVQPADVDVDYQNGVGFFSTIVGGDICGVRGGQTIWLA